MQRFQISPPILQWMPTRAEAETAQREGRGVVRTCLACWRDFPLSLDQDPEAVFFCAECSSPPTPWDELGGGD